MKISNINVCINNFIKISILIIATSFLVVEIYANNHFKLHTVKVGGQLGKASIRNLVRKKLFWTGAVITNNGYMLSYERLVYAYDNFFTINIGTGFANWWYNKEPIYLYRIYPNFKIWFINKTNFGIYLNVGAGGPTILNKRNFKNRDLGSRFTFNDIIGMGLKFGTKQTFEIAINFHHYSNADIFEENPGFDVPAILSVAYTM
jgi:hypothetical protein